jgi:pyruvate kinase
VRHTKIIATVGPASSDTAVLERLITSGVDVFRLNFSHGTPDTHGAVVQNIRAVSRRLDREVAILQDLSGPKIRTGKLQEGKPLILAAGDRLDIKIGSEIGRPGLVSTTYAPLADTLKPRDRLLLDDGKIELAV